MTDAELQGIALQALNMAKTEFESKERKAMKSDYVIEVQKPEWLMEASKEAESLFRLVHQGRIPDSILRWMVVTKCMRVLRSIYGSDLATAAAIRERVLREEADALTWLPDCKEILSQQAQRLQAEAEPEP